ALDRLGVRRGDRDPPRLLGPGLALDGGRVVRRDGDALLLLRLGDLGLPQIIRTLLGDGHLALELGDLHGHVAFGVLDAALALALRVRDRDRALLRRLRDTDLAQLLLLGDVAARLLHRPRAGLPADRLDVAALVVDVRDVHVDQLETDLPELRLERVLDVLAEVLAVAVDLLDPHRRDDLAHLPEDDVRRDAPDLLGREAEQPRRGVHLVLGRVADRDRDLARHPDPDVLERERVGQLARDREREEREEVGLLQDRPDEGAAAADDARGLVLPDSPRDDEDLVRRAAAVPRDEEDEEPDEDESGEPRAEHDRTNRCHRGCLQRLRWAGLPRSR